VEALLSGADPRFPSNLGGTITSAQTDTLLEAGTTIADRCLASPLGIQAREAPSRRSDYPFRSLWETPDKKGIFINGIIDLLFEEGEDVQVVDFKTDSTENPEEHLRQMAFYERAARELRGKPCRVWLYYLRTGRAVEIVRTIR
jgi:ATP-dependent helicase/nuclease subunit A